MRFREQDLVALKNGFVKQNWSKLNLFNLSRLSKTANMGQTKTFFQQKWAAKRLTRKYHGEHLTKRQWQNMFKHSLKSVVPMSSRNFALSDGSEMGGGRGSGLDDSNKKAPPETPYMYQTYAPMERRLDMAIFRAMFASSALQARQFVIHGFVKVNGKTLQYPNYMLNPGDMFSVDLDKILFATGAPKRKPELSQSNSESEEATDEAEAGAEVAETAAVEGEAEAEAKEAAAEDTSSEAAAEAAEADETERREARKGTKDSSREPTYDWQKDPNYPKELDISKPYQTPWYPRDYLSAFAFIPSYLEANHNIGHAVYLRDPVAKPGVSEIPSPFPEDYMQLSYNWYLRRR